MDAALKDQLRELFETKLTREMRLYLDTCARCGVCIEACHVYASIPESRYTAVGRAETIRKLFRKYFKLEGKVFPWLGETLEFNDAAMDKVYEAAYTCTGCRRCMACMLRNCAAESGVVMIFASTASTRIANT